MNTRKANENAQFEKHVDNKKSVDFESCATISWMLQARSSILLLGYTHIIYIFFYLKNI